MKKKHILRKAALFLSALAFFLNAFTASAEKYTASYIDSLYSLPAYYSLFVPIKLNGPKTDFTNNFAQCINIDGEFYSIGLEHSERWSDWEELTADLGSNSLPVNSYAELRELEAFGVAVNSADGRNPCSLYRISEDIIILEDYHCKYNQNGELYHFASKEKYIGYRICRRVPKEKLYKSRWVELDGDKYYIGKDGLPLTKNTVVGGVRYVFDVDGHFQGKYTGWTKNSKGLRYWKDGVLQKNTEVTTESGKTYTIDKNGYAKVKK